MAKIETENEMNKLILRLKIFIKDSKKLNYAIKIVKQYRNKIEYPFPSEPSDKTLAMLLCHTQGKSYYAIKENEKNFVIYCDKLFKTIGLYALEDEWVRDYVYLFLNAKTSKGKRLRAALEKICLSSFQFKNIKRLHDKKKPLPLNKKTKDINMAHSYILYMIALKPDGRSSYRSYRDIAKEVGIHKDTVKKYISEVKDMPDRERKEFFGNVTNSLPDKSSYEDLKAMSRQFSQPE